jgi:hypothetical protein
VTPNPLESDPLQHPGQGGVLPIVVAASAPGAVARIIAPRVSAIVKIAAGLLTLSSLREAQISSKISVARKVVKS